jgi:hypothetical protein
MRRVVYAVLLTAAIAAGAATSAMASGPLPPGKVQQGQVYSATCGGDNVAVTLAANGGTPAHANGAAQFVGESGHVIPLVFNFTTADVTTSTTLDFESHPIGDLHGINAHPNQPTITCRIVLFDGSASDLFGTDLPPGVSPGDEILFTLDVEAILKQ